MKKQYIKPMATLVMINGGEICDATLPICSNANETDALSKKHTFDFFSNDGEEVEENGISHKSVWDD